MKHKVVIFPLLVLIGIVGCSKAPTPSAPATSETKGGVVASVSTRIEYKITWNHETPNGDTRYGYTRYIVISPKNRNETDLKALGEQLRDETAILSFAGVFVFDSEKAALLSRQEAEGQTLSDDEAAFADKHAVGFYIRNINTGVNRLDMMVNGAKGKTDTINY